MGSPFMANVPAKMILFIRCTVQRLVVKVWRGLGASPSPCSFGTTTTSLLRPLQQIETDSIAAEASHRIQRVVGNVLETDACICSVSKDAATIYLHLMFLR
jgi:hypothetical protein